MTGGLEKKRCIPCEGGIPPLSDEESNRFLDQINEDWILVENHHIERIWKFDDFRNALDFVNSAGEICEEENHHAHCSRYRLM